MDGHDLHIRLSSNPSHLEAVYPVVEGRARAMQHNLQDAERKHVLPLVLHGDAAFSGQGIVAEVLNLSLLKGYRTGGTVHLVINNQIGFTTGPDEARSSRYATDVAQMLQSPHPAYQRRKPGRPGMGGGLRAPVPPEIRKGHHSGHVLLPPSGPQ